MQGVYVKFHQYAEVFPLIEGAEFDALVADIKQFGLREKIVTYQGKVLDGRNRFLACQKAKAKQTFRQFKGTDAGALALVISANIQRRHLNASQLQMAGARIATMRKGDNQHASIEAPSQAAAAEILNTSRAGIQRAREVIDHGSKELIAAVDAGEVKVSRAAAVVDLPKKEQMKAATAKPEPPPVDEKWEPEIDEGEQIAAIEREQAAAVDKVMAADDKLSAAYVELKRQAAEIASLKLSRDGYQNQCGELVRRIKKLQRDNSRLEKQVA